MTKDEPVAWGMKGEDGLILDVICPDEHEREEGGYTIPLYTHPKEWVGLSEEEAEEIWQNNDTDWESIKRVEAKLKEKNT